MGKVRESYETRISDKNKSPENVFTAFLNLDHTKVILQRDNYTLRTWAAEVGGIFNMIFAVFYLMCYFMGRYIFMNKMIGEMFLAKPFKQEKKADEIKQEITRN